MNKNTLFIAYSALSEEFRWTVKIIIRQIKSRRMSWARQVACMGQGRNVYRVLVGKPEGKSHFEDQGVDGRMRSK
jgi:hypothetical protein